MGTSQYWTSLWVAGLVILFCFFCLSLGASVFAFFAERISAFEIWNSPFWLKFKIPLIVVGVICFLAAVIAYSRYGERKEMKIAEDYAQTQGWSFSRDATAGLEADVAKILSDLIFRMYHIRTVETGRRNLVLFDCSYKNRDSNSKSDSHGTACLVQSDRFRSTAAPVTIFTRDWTEVMESDKVAMGESPFAREFVVQSKDPDSAQRIVNESIQAILIEHMNKSVSNSNGVSVIIGAGGAVVLTGKTAEHELLQDILDLARKLEAAAS
jgi:hypothetical protein